MSDLYWLTDERNARLKPYFPKSYGYHDDGRWSEWSVRCPPNANGAATPTEHGLVSHGCYPSFELLRSTPERLVCGPHEAPSLRDLGLRAGASCYSSCNTI